MFGAGGTPGGFSFGTTTTTSTATTAATLFGQTQPKTGGFSFGAGTAGGATTSTTPSSFSFGAGTLGGATTQATTTGQTTGLAFGGGGLAAASTTAAPAAPVGSSLGFPLTGAGATTTPATTKPTGLSFGVPASVATTSTVATAPAQGLVFGGGIKLGTGTTTASTSSALPTLGLGVAATKAPTLSLGTVSTVATVASFSAPFGTTAGTTTTSVASTTTSTSVADGKEMNYRQLEESINKWMVELEEQEKIFLQQATQVNAWDRLLMENGEKITELNSDMERVKIDQQKLDHELDFIHSQQRELEQLLVPLEKAMEQLPSISYQQHADLERENTYQLAENIDAQLKRMMQDLKEIIEHLNTGNSNQDNNDPIQQITKILNAHMDSLQWIDQNTALLGRKVEDISKQMETQRKEQERNFRLVYE